MGRRVVLVLACTLALAACGAGSSAPSGTPAESTPAATAATTTMLSPTLASTVAPASEAPIVLPATGSLVYTRYPDNQMQVWVSCLDMSQAHQVPTPAGLAAGYAVWSPGGRRIAFNGATAEPGVAEEDGPWDIYTMNRDGGDLRKLTDATALLGDPAYSPDGTLIAYDSTEGGREGVWVMDATDGGHKRLVAAQPAGNRRDYAPRFSPDGTQLVFDREVDADNDALWIVDLDGTGLHRLTPPGINPDKSEWSPDGSRIVFDATLPGEDISSIWMIDADGTNLVNLTPQADSGEQFSKPTWSPDGSLIMATRGIHPGPSKLGFAVMRPDGTGIRWADDGSGFDHLADWSDAPC